jgi:hypothetical protein
MEKMEKKHEKARSTGDYGSIINVEHIYKNLHVSSVPNFEPCRVGTQRCPRRRPKQRRNVGETQLDSIGW